MCSVLHITGLGALPPARNARHPRDISGQMKPEGGCPC